MNYMKLNYCTQKDHFPLSFIILLLEEVGVHGWVRWLEPNSHSVRKRAQDNIHYTFGNFVCVVMPFGLCNAPATFQRLVMYIFTNLLFKSMTIFIDEFNTQSNTNQHLQCIREALVRCRQMQLALNPN